MPFQIIRGDITKIHADAIVNTANPEVAIGAGVDAAIYEAAGKEQLLLARAKIGELKPGEVDITPAFNLPAKYIIHSSGPIWEGGDYGEAAILRQCYDKCLRLARKNSCESIAFPLMATGTYGFPKTLGMEIAVDAFRVFLEDHEMEITLVVYYDYDEAVSGDLYNEIFGDIDGYDEDLADAGVFCCSVDEVDIYEAAPRAFSLSGAKIASASHESLDDKLKDIYTDSFAKYLKQLLNKKKLKNSEVYAAANISKQYFSKLLNGKVNPSKKKLLCLAVGLRLNMDETIDFLRIAGYALSPIDQTDTIVAYFIESEDYSVIKIDIVLFDYGLEALSQD